MPADLEALSIRRATPADAEPLAELARRSFVEAFGAQNDPDDLAAYTARVYGPAQQGAEIADTAIVTLIGEMEGRMAAYAQVRRGTTAPGVEDASAVELMRFYVDAPWHGRGVAQRMMDATLRAVREQGARTLWLSVWEHNPRGMAFYLKLGFRVVGSHDFWVGSDRQNDHIMSRRVEIDDAGE
jgi:ribosomal protein S18 acetylase RimI-like enzyme